MFYHMFFGVFCDICIYRFTHSTGEHACIPSLPCQKPLFDEFCVFFLSSGLEAASDPLGFGHDKAIVKVPLISSMFRQGDSFKSSSCFACSCAPHDSSHRKERWWCFNGEYPGIISDLMLGLFMLYDIYIYMWIYIYMMWIYIYIYDVNI